MKRNLEEETFETFNEAAIRLIHRLTVNQELKAQIIDNFNTELAIGYQKVKKNN